MSSEELGIEPEDGSSTAESKVNEQNTRSLDLGQIAGMAGAQVLRRQRNEALDRCAALEGENEALKIQIKMLQQQLEGAGKLDA